MQVEHDDLKNKTKGGYTLLNRRPVPAYCLVARRHELVCVSLSFTVCNWQCCLDLMVCSVGVGETAAAFVVFLENNSIH